MAERRRIRPTRAGWAFTATTLAVGFAALNTGNNLLYLVLAMMLSLIGISGVLSELSIRGLEVRRILPPRPVAGRASRGTLLLKNTRRWFPAVAVWTEERTPGVRVTPRFFVVVPAGEEVRGEVVYQFERRGVHHLEAVQVRTTYPFGLFSRAFLRRLPQEVLVYPPLEPVDGRPPGSAQEVGAASANRKGGGDDFFGLRPYVPGDDPRHIHWPSSARQGKALVREDAWHYRRRVLIRLELADPLPEENAYERGLVQVVSWAAALLDDGYEVGVDMPGVQVNFDSGALQRLRVWREAARAPRYAEAAELLHQRVRCPGCRLVRVAVRGQELTVEGWP